MSEVLSQQDQSAQRIFDRMMRMRDPDSGEPLVRVLLRLQRAIVDGGQVRASSQTFGSDTMHIAASFAEWLNVLGELPAQDAAVA